MTFTLVHTADIHLDRAFTGDTARVDAGTRRRAIRDAYLRIINLARRADALCIAGDLYEHENVTPDTEALIVRTLGELGKPVLLLPGNHDPYLPGSVYQRADWSANVHVFTRPEPEPFNLTDDIVIWGLAYTLRELRPDSVRSFRVPQDGRTHLLLLHASVTTGYFGAEGDHCPVTLDELAATGAAHVLLGHYHDGRTWGRATYPGSPEPLTWGERGTHAVNRLTLEDGRATPELIPVNRMSFDELTVDVTGAQDSAELERTVEDRIRPSADPGLALRVVLTGTVDEGCEVHPAELANGLSEGFGDIVIVDATEMPYDLETIAQEATVRGRFVAKLIERAEANPESRAQLRQAAVTGLRALAGRRDLVDVD